MTGTMTPSQSTLADNPPGVLSFITPNIATFTSGRGKIVGNDSYSTFNICHYTGDEPGHVEACRKQLCDFLSIEPRQLIIPRQTHSVNVAVVRDLPVCDTDIENTDAIVTPLPDIAIAVNTADCVPILFADPDTGIIAAAHSGWKGTVGKIVVRTIEIMVSLGAKPENITAMTGPCICGDCFDVGNEVVEQFISSGLSSTDIILQRHPRKHINLRQAVNTSLLQAGLKPQNITISRHCSRCEHNELFSARKLGVKSGRTLSLIIRYSNIPSQLIQRN